MGGVASWKEDVVVRDALVVSGGAMTVDGVFVVVAIVEDSSVVVVASNVCVEVSVLGLADRRGIRTYLGAVQNAYTHPLLGLVPEKL